MHPFCDLNWQSEARQHGAAWRSMLTCWLLSVGSTRNTTQLPSAAPWFAMALLSGLKGRAATALAASRRFAAQVPKTVEQTQVSKNIHIS